MKDFIRKCLTNDENRRLGIYELYSHPFILRITEDEGLPQLLRKQTSVGDQPSSSQNIPLSRQHSKSGQNNGNVEQIFAKDENPHYLENVGTGNEPTNIHHRKNHSKNRSEKQFTSQLNFMRYIFRFLEMFPPVEESGRYTFGLRFLATKLMLSQLDNLKSSLNF